MELAFNLQTPNSTYFLLLFLFLKPTFCNKHHGASHVSIRTNPSSILILLQAAAFWHLPRLRGTHRSSVLCLQKTSPGTAGWAENSWVLGRNEGRAPEWAVPLFKFLWNFLPKEEGRPTVRGRFSVIGLLLAKLLR